MKKILVLISLLLNLILIMGLVFILILKGPSWYQQKITSVFSNNEINTLTMDDNNYKTNKSIFYSLENKSRKHKIVFLGDSITQNSNWNELFNNENIINRGINGDTTRGILGRINDIIYLEPKKVFIMVGINDISKGSTVEQVFNNYKNIIYDIQKGTPSTMIYIQSTLPINNSINKSKLSSTKIIDLNERLKDFSETEKITYIDLYSSFIDKNNYLKETYTIDGVHLNGAGYKIWQDNIDKYVK